jgi:hypothetical protein
VAPSLRKRDILGISAQQIADALEFSKTNLLSRQNQGGLALSHLCGHPAVHDQAHGRRDGPAPIRLGTLAAVIDVYMQLMIDHAAVMQVWFREKDHLSAKHRAEIERLEARVKAILGPFYTKAIGSGEFRDVDPQLAAVAMFGMCFAVTRWPDLQKRLSARKLTEGMQALALGAMLRPKG